MTQLTRIAIFLLLVLMLTILPLPAVIVSFRPPWILLALLYIQFYLDNFSSVALVFFLGLVTDALLSTVIGEHVLALSLAMGLANLKSRRFYLLSMPIQMIWVSFFCLFYQSMLVVINAFLGFYDGFFSIAITSFISMMLWPWIRLMADDMLLFNLNHR